MPVSGLLVTLPEDAESRRRALQHIAADPRLTAGARDARRLAVVAETTSAAEDRALLDALQAFDGLFVDVVFYDFSDEQAFDVPQRRRSTASRQEGG